MMNPPSNRVRLARVLRLLRQVDTRPGVPCPTLRAYLLSRVAALAWRLWDESSTADPTTARLAMRTLYRIMHRYPSAVR